MARRATVTGGPLDWNGEEMAAGLRAYRGGDFFEAHERWETVWRTAREPAKTLVQALIQVAAALHHVDRANPRGARTLFRAALEKVERYDRRFGQLSVETLRDGIRRWLSALDAPGSVPWPAPPSLVVGIEAGVPVDDPNGSAQ